VIWCRTCLMPSSRPRMPMMADGRCSACHFHDTLRTVDYEQRKKDFLDLVKRKKRHSSYDCLVAFSGGKDSASIAHRLKYDLGLNPLLCCYAQCIWTDVGRRNLHRVADAGFDIDYLRVNQKVSRALARRFFIERGHPKQHYDSGINATVIKAALRWDIPLVIYAEHGESYYGGHVLSEEHRRRRDLSEVLENQVGDDARNWAVDGITEADLDPYIMPPNAGDIEAVYYAHYFPWSIHENTKYVQAKMGFEGVVPRSDGTFDSTDSIDDAIDGTDFWQMHLKFGFGRAARMATRLIHLGVMGRAQGLDLVRKYDGEFPEMYLDQVLDYLSLTRSEYIEIADMHRNPEIWSRADGAWQLRHPPQ
jgi:N-acetyl sugar amidotransferase